MSKMVIFNCPAYKGLTKDIPDWLDNTNCGYYTGQVPCQDCTDCVMKQIVELCKSACIDCSSIKRVTYIQCKDLNNCKTAKILKLLDIQECE